MDKKLKQLRKELKELEAAAVKLAEVRIAIAELEGINEREPVLVPRKRLAGFLPVGSSSGKVKIDFLFYLWAALFLVFAILAAPPRVAPDIESHAAEVSE